MLPTVLKPFSNSMIENTKQDDVVNNISEKLDLNLKRNCQSVQGFASESENKENKSTNIVCNLENKIMTQMESSESLEMELRKESKCASKKCNRQDMLWAYPAVLFDLSAEWQRKILSDLGNHFIIFLQVYYWAFFSLKFNAFIHPDL